MMIVLAKFKFMTFALEDLKFFGIIAFQKMRNQIVVLKIWATLGFHVPFSSPKM
jgi:hypothetical protein